MADDEYERQVAKMENCTDPMNRNTPFGWVNPKYRPGAGSSRGGSSSFFRSLASWRALPCCFLSAGLCHPLVRFLGLGFVAWLFDSVD